MLKCFQNLPYLVESSWDMEASLPLSALEGKKDFTATVQVTIPLRVLIVLEM